MAKNIRLDVGNDITIEQGFERFLRWCRLKGFSEYTIEFYDEIRMNFARFKNLDEPIEDINRELFEDYILFLQKTDVSSLINSILMPCLSDRTLGIDKPLPICRSI